MTVTWSEPVRIAPRNGDLQLLRDGVELPAVADDPRQGLGWVERSPVRPPLTVVPERRRRAPRERRTSLEVRRRRTLLAVMGLLLLALALPLSGTGGHSHPAGSALAETGRPVAYTVRPGDTLWTIAERVDPSADPRPQVARLAARLGTDTVVPGERIVLP
jgi:LysM domain